MKRLCCAVLYTVGALVFALSASAYADYSFWGIDLSTAEYHGDEQLSFSNVAPDMQWSVGSYEYTQVNGAWAGPFGAASPGTGYDVHRVFDAQALFFKHDSEFAYFAFIGGMPTDGFTWPDGGYGDREFGVGDIYLEIGGETYGIGMREGGLFWVNGRNRHLKIRDAETGRPVDPSVRTEGTAGTVERNPHWYHTNNANHRPGSDAARSFFEAGSGTQTGTGDFAAEGTGVALEGFESYAYFVTVPWDALGFDHEPQGENLRAHMGMDCGNDYLLGEFQVAIPEPATTSVIGLALSAVAAGVWRRMRS